MKTNVLGLFLCFVHVKSEDLNLDERFAAFEKKLSQEWSKNLDALVEQKCREKMEHQRLEFEAQIDALEKNMAAKYGLEEKYAENDLEARVDLLETFHETSFNGKIFSAFQNYSST